MPSCLKKVHLDGSYDVLTRDSARSMMTRLESTALASLLHATAGAIDALPGYRT